MISLYIHIPFCIRKCSYCDFVSYAGHNSEMFLRYIDGLCREIEVRGNLIQTGISTLYIGGGTPSLLSPILIEKIFSSILKQCPSFSPNIEISMEVNPATVSRKNLKDLRNIGINRISLGMQSFNDRMLATLGRIHTAEQAVTTYKECRQAGFDNINIDLMFALPGQDIKLWYQDIHTAVEFSPDHLSLYNLQVEEGTSLWRKQQKGLIVLPTEEEDAQMYTCAVRYLAAKGYPRYEISNFARETRECLHNLTYWKNNNYLGIGVAAHSHIDGTRWANTSSLEDYLFAPENAVVEEIKGTPLSIKQEKIFLGLRLAEGVKKTFFVGYEQQVEQLIQDGLLEEFETNYRLTDKGVLLGNRVFCCFV